MNAKILVNFNKRTSKHSTLEYELNLRQKNKTSEFYRQTFEKQTPNFMKIRPAGAEMFHADQRTRRSWRSLFAIFRTRLETRFFFLVFSVRASNSILLTTGRPGTEDVREEGAENTWT